MSRLRYPARRADVILMLAVLSDPDYQARHWLPEDFGNDEASHLFAIEAMFLEDERVMSNPRELIGGILFDNDNFDRLEELGRLLDDLITDHGEKTAAKLGDPRWPAVVRQAGLALASMIQAGLPWEGEDWQR